MKCSMMRNLLQRRLLLDQLRIPDMGSGHSMNKYAYLAQHGLPSALGWMRTSAETPGFAFKLLLSRSRYFFRRRFDAPLITPGRFVLETPDSLVTYWSMFVERELHSPLWVEPLKRAKAPLVLDVGANVGLFSHLVHTINPTARIIAFEPLTALFAKLQKLPAQTGMNFEPRNFAVGRAPGEAEMESPHGYDGISRINRGGTSGGGGMKVKVTTLDDEVPEQEVFLLKMDVEDYETEVIAGASNVLSRTRYVLTEARTDEFRDAITAGLGPQWERHKLSGTDYLFSRRAAS